jgi:hypothetical protein
MGNALEFEKIRVDRAFINIEERDVIESDLNPSKTSHAAICEYVRTRPRNYGCYLERYRSLHKDIVDVNCMTDRIKRIMDYDPTPECHPIVGAIRWHFRTGTGAPWGPAALYEQVLKDRLLTESCAVA